MKSWKFLKLPSKKYTQNVHSRERSGVRTKRDQILKNAIFNHAEVPWPKAITIFLEVVSVRISRRLICSSDWILKYSVEMVPITATIIDQRPHKTAETLSGWLTFSVACPAGMPQLINGLVYANTGCVTDVCDSRWCMNIDTPATVNEIH